MACSNNKKRTIAFIDRAYSVGFANISIQTDLNGILPIEKFSSEQTMIVLENKYLSIDTVVITVIVKFNTCDRVVVEH